MHKITHFNGKIKHFFLGRPHFHWGRGHPIPGPTSLGAFSASIVVPLAREPPIRTSDTDKILIVTAKRQSIALRALHLLYIFLSAALSRPPLLLLLHFPGAASDSVRAILLLFFTPSSLLKSCRYRQRPTRSECLVGKRRDATTHEK